MSRSCLLTLALAAPALTPASASVPKMVLVTERDGLLESNGHGVLVHPDPGWGCLVDLYDDDAGCGDEPVPFDPFGVFAWLYEVYGDLSGCFVSVDNAFNQCILDGADAACCAAMKALYIDVCEANPHFRVGRGQFSGFCDAMVGSPGTRPWIGPDDVIAATYVVGEPLVYLDPAGDGWTCTLTGEAVLVVDEDDGYLLRVDPAGLSGCSPLPLAQPWLRTR